MPSYAIGGKQARQLGRVLGALARQAEAEALVIMDIGGNIITRVCEMDDHRVQTVAALAAGSFAATREMAAQLGEPAFQSVFHRGETNSVYIHGLTANFLILLVLGPNSTQGLAKLYLEKCSVRLRSILESTEGQSAAGAGLTRAFEYAEDEDPFRSGT
jgi:predicted regulator of Ras-like GTPase activity (Roadblock/LC7/MglB family)